jgi:hypothetical protein
MAKVEHGVEARKSISDGGEEAHVLVAGDGEFGRVCGCCFSATPRLPSSMVAQNLLVEVNLLKPISSSSRRRSTTM